ncbi:MAG: DUF3987 domain-containing protein [Culturomica sp.]|jgi:hypothetical protein|nr:DUF3987 domain-containing protein [Culturomica sp.]
MSKKTFNPQEWTTPNNTPATPNTNPTTGIETITARIEAATADIAPNYTDWRDTGFALADALGENGRNYYHRLSRFNPGYTPNETDQQYDNCLKAHGHGITIKTLYHLAKQAGIDISTPDISKLSNYHSGNLAKQTTNTCKLSFCQNREMEKSETLKQTDEEPAPPPGAPGPAKIYALLPNYLRQIAGYANSNEDADLLLLGSLTVISACLSNIYGIYGGVTVHPNLFLFVTAQASAGKGRLSLCRRLVEPIHRQLRELNKLEIDQYKRKQAQYIANKKDPDTQQPEEPPLRVLFIPANSSATAVFQILNDNNGVGLMFETEGDTLAQTFKTEHGNYSDGFRKAFHHEKISYLRRKDREYVTLEIPKLSALLSGTPRQVQSLIPDAENGLFSRFIFYHMNIRLQWINVFACDPNESLDQRFNRFGEQFLGFHQTLNQHPNIRFTLSGSQQTAFNHYFEQAQQQYWELLGNDYIGTIRRLGLTTFRITMILTILRIMDTGDISETITCTDTDFQIAMEITKTLQQHAAYIFRQLPTTTPAPTTNPKMALYQALPAQFNRTTYTQIAAQLQIPESTADKQIARFLNAGLLIRQTHGNYTKKDT